MADRFYGYQYDTNPRKLNTEYTPYRKRYPQENEPVKTTNKNRPKTNKQVTSKNSKVNNNVQASKQRKNRERMEAVREQANVQNEKKTKANVKAKLKIVMFLMAGFSILFAISYQNSLISESFNKKEQYKKEMEALSKTNQQIEVSIENNLNLNNIEQVAKEKIGMQKLNNDQKIYVSLPKEDYVAPAAEQVVIEEDVGFFEKLIQGFTKTIN